MSAVKKSAKVVLVVFGVIVLLVAGLAGYLYMNMNTLAKNFAEKAASEALGVAVTIGEVDISLEEMKVAVNDIAVANPKGFKNKNAITIKNITVDGESFSKEKLVFSLIQVDGTAVNLEVGENGVNLGTLKKNTQGATQQTSQQTATETSSGSTSDIKVIVRKFALTGAQMTPSVTLLGNNNMGDVKVSDIVLKGIGEKENGVIAQEAIAQIMNAVLDKFNSTANSAGFLEGLPLNMLNDIGVSTGEVFTKNLKKSYTKEVDKFKKGLNSLKGVFE